MRPQSRDQAAAWCTARSRRCCRRLRGRPGSRLRSLVRDASRVDAAGLRAAGAFGVMISGRVVQVVVGPHVDLIATDLDELM